MESEWIARIYESRLWRRNPIIALLQGISFERERSLIERALLVRDDAVVLDLACGPGIHSRPLAARARRGLVIGIDLSPATSVLLGILPVPGTSAQLIPTSPALNDLTVYFQALATTGNTWKPSGRLDLTL